MDFGRLITAMITPFHEDGSINYSEAQRLANYLLDNGSDGLCVAGTTGESATMNPEERKQLFLAVQEVTRERGASLIAGCGSNNTAETIRLCRMAQEVGADAALLVTPYYNKPPQDALYAHYAAVAEAVELPLVLYNVPGRTGVNMKPDTVARLAQLPNIVALKEATGDMDQMSLLSAKTPADFLIYSGEDSAVLPMLSLGACGVISVSSHIVGSAMKEMIVAWENGEKEEALELHLSCFEAFQKMFLTTNPLPVKYAMQRLGFQVGPCRLPLTWVTEEQAASIDALLTNLGLL